MAKKTSTPDVHPAEAVLLDLAARGLLRPPGGGDLGDDMCAAACRPGFLDAVLDQHLGTMAFLVGLGSEDEFAKSVAAALLSIGNLAKRVRAGDANASAELKRVGALAPDKASMGLAGNNKLAYEVVERKLTAFFTAAAKGSDWPAWCLPTLKLAGFPPLSGNRDLAIAIAVVIDELLTSHFKWFTTLRLLGDRPELEKYRERLEAAVGVPLPKFKHRIVLLRTIAWREINRTKGEDVDAWDGLSSAQRARQVLHKSLSAFGVKEPSSLHATQTRRDSRSKARRSRPQLRTV